jgi:hypothetical protein
MDRNLRPVIYYGQKARFHKWIEKDEIIQKANTVISISMTERLKYASYTDGFVVPEYIDLVVVKKILAIIEMEETGEVKEVPPVDVIFDVEEEKRINEMMDKCYREEVELITGYKCEEVSSRSVGLLIPLIHVERFDDVLEGRVKLVIFDNGCGLTDEEKKLLANYYLSIDRGIEVTFK